MKLAQLFLYTVLMVSGIGVSVSIGLMFITWFFLPWNSDDFLFWWKVFSISTIAAVYSGFKSAEMFD